MQVQAERRMNRRVEVRENPWKMFASRSQLELDPVHLVPALEDDG